MNVGDLKQILEDYDDDIEIRFASQPAYPFEYSIEDVYLVDMDNLVNEDKEESDSVLYLVEGNQLGYLSGKVRECIGW
jgi:hypothetical protein